MKIVEFFCLCVMVPVLVHLPIKKKKKMLLLHFPGVTVRFRRQVGKCFTKTKTSATDFKAQRRCSEMLKL